MEYNVDLLDGLDIYNENSLTLILKRIQPGTTVLEFGPAYGRMTRFLNEELGCHVSCIELNPKAEDALKKFADKVVIGNIEDYHWTTEFKKNFFDYIIFADVLEHLADPAKVLCTVTPFLKESGTIYISVPNIAHNAIVESLYYNQFNYQESGILDKTHLRFFTKSSLEKMISSANLLVSSKQATYYSDEMTGILANFTEPYDIEFENMLKNRPYANVYQLVYGIKKNISNITIEDTIQKYAYSYSSVLYLDTGYGFTENNSLAHQIKCSLTENEVTFSVNSDSNIKQIRFDPIEPSCICVLNEFYIKTSDGNILSYDVSNFSGNYDVSCKNVYIFGNTDPQFYIENIDLPVSTIYIKYSISHVNIQNSILYDLLKNTFQDNVQSTIQREHFSSEQIIEQKNREISALVDAEHFVRKESDERAQHIAELEAQLQVCKQEINNVNTTLQSLSDENNHIRQESEERAQRIAAVEYNLNLSEKTLQQKCLEITSLEDSLVSKQELLDERFKEIMSLRAIAKQQEQELSTLKQKLFNKNIKLLEYEDQLLEKANSFNKN